MASKMWVIVGAVLVMAACGSRDRTPGTRGGSGSPNGTVRDSGVVTGDTDGGIPGVDAGQLDAGGLADSGGEPVALDPNKALTALTPAEVMALCERMVAAQGTQPAECGDGLTVNPNTYEECVAEQSSAAGTCTVGQVLECMDSLQGDLCNFLMTPACAALFEC